MILAMSDPEDPLKVFCNRAAELARTGDGARLLRRFSLLGFLGSEGPIAGPPSEPEVDPTPNDPVGIWKRETEAGKGGFTRRLDCFREWKFWANLGRIEAKGDRLRVVLLGESVARGFLYDPVYTPALVLQAVLDSRLGHGAVEVLDLARTNLGFGLEELSRSALMLEPDAVVLFAGNNWTAALPRKLPGLAEILALLSGGGGPALKGWAESHLEERARDLVGKVSSTYAAAGVPLVWLLPEFNLGDWREPVTNAPLLRAPTANRDWMESSRQAQEALARGDLVCATKAARRMVELDQGVSIAGLYLLAECSLRRRDLAQARGHLEAARDAVIWDASRDVSPARSGSRSAFSARRPCGMGTRWSTCRQLFGEYLGGDIPDRRLFLDYCHLTAEGIRVAMAATAAQILGMLGKATAPWRELMATASAPSPKVEAEAAFLAAVHNAHWWQPQDIVRYHCIRSLRAQPAMAEIMARFAEIQTRHTPMLLCRAAEEIAASGSPLIQHYLLGYNIQQMDPVLIGAITLALEEIGVSLEDGLARVRRQEHDLSSGYSDLLDYYYCSAGRQPQEVSWVLPGRTEQGRRRGALFIEPILSNRDSLSSARRAEGWGSG